MFILQKVTFVMGSSYMKKWYCLCFYVTWFKSYGLYKLSQFVYDEIQDGRQMNPMGH